MASTSLHYQIAEHVSRFMLAFSKAQTLEAALAYAPTPSTKRSSTLGLLWGITLGHAGSVGCHERTALTAVQLILEKLPGGADALRWFTAHREDDEFLAWAELGEMAYRQSLRDRDSMPALMDLARDFREDAGAGALPRSETMPMPGGRLLEEHATHRNP